MPRLSARDIHRLSAEARKQIRRALRSTSPIEPEVSPHTEGADPPSKYRNIRTTVDGFLFASQREAQRYAELKLELLAGAITDLELQKPFPLDVNGMHVCDYVADFVYQRNGAQVVEDAKGQRLELFRIKKSLMFAIHAIEVVEV